MSRRVTAPGALRMGGLALAAVVAVSGCGFRGAESIPLPGGPDLGSDPKTVKVEFGNVLDLVPQSVVKVNDVSVGKVDEIELSGTGGSWHAVVTLRMRGDVKLPDNAVANVGQTSLLGEKYVAIGAPPTAPSPNPLGDGDVIPLSRTTKSTEIEEVLSAMSMLLNGGGIEQISTITRELNATMNGRTSEIKSVLRQVDAFVGTLDKNRAAIVRALDSLDRLSTKLSDERTTINDTISRTGPALTVLNQNRADLTRMLTALNRLSRTTTGVIKASRDDLLANLRALEPTLRNLNKAGDKVPRNLETLITYPFSATFNNVVKGDYGNIHITVDLDFEELSKNLLGGTDLDPKLTGQSMMSRLKVPNVTVPRTPLGGLPQTDTQGQGGIPGLPGQQPNQQNGQTPGKPRAAGDTGLRHLLTGGLS